MAVDCPEPVDPWRGTVTDQARALEVATTATATQITPLWYPPMSAGWVEVRCRELFVDLYADQAVARVVDSRLYRLGPASSVLFRCLGQIRWRVRGVIGAGVSVDLQTGLVGTAQRDPRIRLLWYPDGYRPDERRPVSIYADGTDRATIPITSTVAIGYPPGVSDGATVYGVAGAVQADLLVVDGITGTTITTVPFVGGRAVIDHLDPWMRLDVRNNSGADALPVIVSWSTRAVAQ